MRRSDEAVAAAKRGLEMPGCDFVTKGDYEGENFYRALGRTESGRYLVVFFVYKGSGRALPLAYARC